MGVVERLAQRVLDEPISLERREVERCVRRLAPTEAPLLSEDQTATVVDSVLGLGPLEGLLRNPEISDILVNGDGRVWVERNGELELATVGFGRPTDLIAAVERTIAPLGLRLDRASPAVDARLPDGSRLHAAIPPVSVDGPVLAIRRFTAAATSIDDLIGLDSVNAEGADMLRRLVEQRRNVIVCGATGSGKTTLLNVLSSEIAAGERIVTVEDAAELRLSGHVIRLEARPGNSEGFGAVSMRALLRHALRLRPDRIIVGEVRGAEAFDLVQALSTGHEGSMSTLHASSPEETLWRLESLALLDSAAAAGSMRAQIRRVVDAVVVMGRRRGRRAVRGIHLIDSDPSEVCACS